MPGELSLVAADGRAFRLVASSSSVPRLVQYIISLGSLLDSEKTPPGMRGTCTNWVKGSDKIISARDCTDCTALTALH
jgi:hypothetical protein